MLGIPFLNKFVENTVKKQTVADFCDHLNYYVTSYLLGFFAIGISAKQYFGSPIQCWVPSEFRGGWEKYAEDYCFIANSYHVPIDNEIPQHGEGREDHISYYRWVPIMLALQVRQPLAVYSLFSPCASSSLTTSGILCTSRRPSTPRPS